MSWSFYPYGNNLRNPLDRQKCGLQNLAELSRELHNTFPQDVGEEEEIGWSLGNKCEVLIVSAGILV
jgi:hypothetical protein